jgi:TetR/AcrR family fatty acid metabolism transcriptional regulator
MLKKTDRRTQILEAAVKVFAHHGFYNSKVADVAKSAGVADGTIYLYFKNKDDLLISLFETKMEEFLHHFKKALLPISSAEEKLQKFIQQYFLLIQEDQDLAEVFQVELRQSSKFLKDYHNQKFIDFLNIIGEILNEGQINGEFRNDFKINTMKIVIFGALDELARQWILSNDPKFTIQEAAVDVSKFLILGLLTPTSGE